MNTRQLTVAGHKVEVAEVGQGKPLVYLHGFADVHAASVGWLPFHEELSNSFRLIAPAAPGCAGSAEDEWIENIDDVAFRYIEILDALGLQKFDLAGTCFGGWIAAELAVRHPERVNRLALIAASGLFLAGKPTGDLFWEMQPTDGSLYPGLRKLLFAKDGELAKANVPRRARGARGRDEPVQVDAVLLPRRLQPAVLLQPQAAAAPGALQRAGADRLGRGDRMVPVEHARAYQADSRARSW